MKAFQQQHRVVVESGGNNRVPLKPPPLKPPIKILNEGDLSSLPKIDSARNRIDSARTSRSADETDLLKNKIKDLEKENVKLRHHVKQAELSIKNYRGFLSGGSAKTARDIGVQTDVETRPASRAGNKRSDEKLLLAAERKLLELTKSNTELEQRVSSLVEEKSDFTNQQNQEQNRVGELEEFCQKSKDRSFNLQSYSLHSRLSLSKLKLELESSKTHIQHSLSNFMAMCRSEYEELVHRMALREEKWKLEENRLVSCRQEEEASMNELNLQLKDSRSKIGELQERLAKVELEKSDLTCIIHKHSQMKHSPMKSSPIKTSSQACMTSPLTSNATSNAESLHLHDQSRSPKSTTKQDVARELREMREISMFELLRANQVISEKELAISETRKVVECKMVELMEFSRRIETALQLTRSLHIVHAAEVKALKALSHTKELVRVAKEREADIEREKLVYQIKHLK